MLVQMNNWNAAFGTPSRLHTYNTRQVQETCLFYKVQPLVPCVICEIFTGMMDPARGFEYFAIWYEG